MGLLITAPAASAAPTSPFPGARISTDPGDGSTQHLYIQGGTHAQIVYVDEFATVCLDEGSPVTIFTAFLTGTVSGDTLDATFRIAKCGPVTLRFLGSYTLAYDPHGAGPADDTLVDGYGVSWYRD